MGTFMADLRYAFRMMRANPGFTAVAITVLALGIAANTAIFTVVDSVLLQPLPFPEPDRLMQVGRLYPGNNYGFSNSIPKYMVWRNNDAFDSMALFGQGGPGMNLGTGDRPEQVRVLRASDGYFRVFGVSPILGRTYTATEDVPNGPNVVVITYSLWQSRLGGNPNIVGSSIVLNGVPHTVVGVHILAVAEPPGRQSQHCGQLDRFEWRAAYCRRRLGARVPTGFARRSFSAAAGRPQQHEPGTLSAGRRTAEARRHSGIRKRANEGGRRALPCSLPEEHG
jgi:hypothetical protein